MEQDHSGENGWRLKRRDEEKKQRERERKSFAVLSKRMEGMKRMRRNN